MIGFDWAGIHERRTALAVLILWTVLPFRRGTCARCLPNLCPDFELALATAFAWRMNG